MLRCVQHSSSIVPVTENFPAVSTVMFAFSEGKVGAALHTFVHSLISQPVLHHSS